MTLQPDHRRVLAVSGSAADDPRVDALAALLTGQPCLLDDVTYANDLYEKPEHRAAVDAFFLARVPLEQMSVSLDIPVMVLDTYAYLFMDMQAFRNNLEIRSYALAYEGDEYERELVRTAVVAGRDYLIWTYGENNQGAVDSRDVIRRTMVDGYFRGMAHKGNGVSTQVAKDAQRWLQMAVNNALMLEKVDPHATKDAFSELKIAIEGKDITVSAENTPVDPENVLH